MRVFGNGGRKAPGSRPVLRLRRGCGPAQGAMPAWPADMLAPGSILSRPGGFVKTGFHPSMMRRISSSVCFMPSLPRRPTLRIVFSTPFLTMPSPPRNCLPESAIW